MKRIIFCFILFSASIYNAQIKFEKGYIITQNSEKKDVLIKNIEWMNSPEEFIYKIDENSPEQNGNISNTKEFGVYGYSIFINYSGSIDISPTKLSFLSSSKEPELKQVQVFLKQLVSGDKKLYSYRSKNILNYFYSDGNSSNSPKLLIYKKYHPKGDNMLVATNEDYKNQLNSLFSESDATRKKIAFARYNDQDLIKVFDGSNQPIPTASEQKNRQSKQGKFNLNIRPGYNFYPDVKIVNFMGNQQLPSTSNFRIGIEAEVLLPFNKNKWSLIFEPNYSVYTSKNTKITSKNINYNHYIDFNKYAFIDIPVGVRHYMYINEKSRFFVNTQINLIRIKSTNTKTIDIKDGDYSILTASFANSKPLSSLMFGTGFNYNNKYTLELRYNTSSEMLKNEDKRSASLQYFSVILGYNIF
ncbi:porin family protein [Chryseobacterium indoltheticum]|uniref:hypothetical protein n=1 Tax=Chryseobacterium indoltheticum TaxID=254 RepID=UPI0019132357|nr:hypothetical protein [Chryseobacterium indoltheticum]QQQ28017.1 hypothetical protein JJL46_18390 [Chryseobacterium indoltheticum]